MLVVVRSFSYTPDASFSDEFLSHARLMLDLVRSFSYTTDARFSEEFLLHSWC